MDNDDERLTKVESSTTSPTKKQAGKKRKRFPSLPPPGNESAESDAKKLHNVESQVLLNEEKTRETLLEVVIQTYSTSSEPNDPLDGIELLSKFINCVKTAPPDKNYSQASFKLKATKEFFKEEYYPLFANCLTLCGSGLVKLDIQFPRDGGSMPFCFPNLSLDTLHTFSVTLGPSGIMKEGGGNAPLINNSNAAHLIQCIFNGGKQLKEFLVEVDSFNDVPFGFQYILLPTTLTTVHFKCLLKSSELEILLKNPLPCLKELVIVSPAATPLEKGLIFKILSHVQNSLEDFGIYGFEYRAEKDEPTYFRFPLMEKLTTLITSPMHFRLEPAISSLEKYLPKLTNIHLKNQTIPMFNEWTMDSKFESVTSLAVSLGDENVNENEKGFAVNFSLELMKSLHRAFPNVQQLILTLSGQEMNGLKYLFKEMTKIRVLGITVVTTNNEESIESSHFWDSLLAGVELETGTDVGRTNAVLNKNVLPTIRNLSELQELCLTSTCPGGTSSSENETALISDVVFSSAFLKMEKLKVLKFGGRFRASPEMENQWKSQNRMYETRF